MPRKACVFCGETADKSSREHVFGKWIRQALNVDIMAEAERISVDGTVRRWKDRAFDQTVNVVCRTCNSTWMSELENQVRPILTPMLFGQSQRLGRPRQNLLATWATKTALMIAQMEPGANVFGPADYEHLYTTRQPSTGTLVWLSTQQPRADDRGLRIAQSTARNIRAQVRTADGRSPADAPDQYQAGVVMFGIRNFVVTVFSHSLPTELDLNIAEQRSGLRFEDHFRQVWPITRERLRWPPRDLGEVGGFDGMFRAWVDA